jgi:type IV pilus assembly protein PilO
MAKWSDIPVLARLGIIIGVAVAVFVAMYFVAFKSLREENAANQLTLNTKKAENEKLAKIYEPRLTEVNRRIEMLKQQLEIQKRIVPDEKEASEFIRLLQDRAQTSGIEIRRYTANNAVTKEFYTEVPFEVELDGPYFSVLNFFEKVAKMERIINVSNLKMSGIASRSSVARRRYSYAPGESVAATCVATTFFSHDATPQAPAKPGAPAPAK